MHGIDQDQAFGDAAVGEALLHLGGDIDEGPAAGDLKPEFLAKAFHGSGVAPGFAQRCHRTAPVSRGGEGRAGEGQGKAHRGSGADEGPSQGNPTPGPDTGSSNRLPPPRPSPPRGRGQREESAPTRPW